MFSDEKSEKDKLFAMTPKERAAYRKEKRLAAQPAPTTATNAAPQAPLTKEDPFARGL
jgi:hypothetical protein